MDIYSEILAEDYNVDEYGEIINGELTYKTISNKLLVKGDCLIGWSNESGLHFDILFMYQTTFAGANIQGGIRPTDLFISVMRIGSFGFQIDNHKSPKYIAEKLSIYGKSTAEKLTELINGVIGQMIKQEKK